MTIRPQPMPFGEAIARPRDWVKYPNPRDKDPNEGLVRDPWIDSLTQQQDQVQAAPNRITATELLDQNASIGATPLDIGDAPQGLYRVTYYFRVTTPAATSSSLAITFGWTDGSVSITKSGSAETGNTTTTMQSGTLMLNIDSGSPITYATTYASNGAGEMRYSLYITVERVLA